MKVHDFILREEEDRYQVYFEDDFGIRNIGCFESEVLARNNWVKAQKQINNVDASPENVDLYQSRTCSGDPPFLLKKGIV